jgi:hypothetical protein
VEVPRLAEQLLDLQEYLFSIKLVCHMFIMYTQDHSVNPTFIHTEIIVVFNGFCEQIDTTLTTQYTHTRLQPVREKMERIYC